MTGVFTELPQEVGNDYYANRGWLSRGARYTPQVRTIGATWSRWTSTPARSCGATRWPREPRSAALTTGGGLVVGADTDRNLYIYDAANGDVLFQTRLPASVQGFPITYAVEGRQYLVAPVGGNRSNAIYVFALPQQASRVSAPVTNGRR